VSVAFAQNNTFSNSIVSTSVIQRKPPKKNKYISYLMDSYASYDNMRLLRKKLIDKLETSTSVKDHSFFFQKIETKIW
jgi:hypothetical protein